RVQRENAVEKPLPAFLIVQRVPALFLPLSIQRVEGDRLPQEREIMIVAHLFHPSQPTARPMKPNARGAVFQSHLMRLPPAPQIAHCKVFGHYAHRGWRENAWSKTILPVSYVDR